VAVALFLSTYVHGWSAPAEDATGARSPNLPRPEPNKREGPDTGSFERQITVDRSSTTTAPHQQHHAALNTLVKRASRCPNQSLIRRSLAWERDRQIGMCQEPLLDHRANQPSLPRSPSSPRDPHYRLPPLIDNLD
jgi:hypothetical protein